MYLKNTFLIFFILVILMSVAGDSAKALSFSATSGLIRIPVASVEQSYGYQSAGNDKWFTFSRLYLMNRLEIGARRHLSGGYTTGGYKLCLIQPGSMMPGFAFGAYDVGSRDRQPTYFVASTLVIDSTGTIFHAGILSEGAWKGTFDLAKSLDFRKAVDLASRTRAWYFGIEQSILPMFSVLGEHIDGVVNAGIRLRPVYQLTLDAVVLDVNRLRDWPDRKAYNLNLSFSF